MTRLVPVLATATKVPFPYVTVCHEFASAAELKDQLIPFVLDITRFVPSEETATKVPFPKVTEFQPLFSGAVRVVQVTPSGLVIIRAPVPTLATATNSPFPKVTLLQLLVLSDAGLPDQFKPLSVLRIVLVPVVDATATKIPFPNATEFQLAAAEAGISVQLVPLFVLLIKNAELETEIKVPFPKATEVNVCPLPSF